MNVLCKILLILMFCLSLTSTEAGSRGYVAPIRADSSPRDGQDTPEAKAKKAKEEAENKAIEEADNKIPELKPLSYVLLCNGYRWDRIANTASLGGQVVANKGSTQTLKKINSYQLGGIGQCIFCHRAFLRGAAHYGWVWDGLYSEGGLFGRSKGYTFDLQGAVGYYFSVSRTIMITPVAGWSYDALNLKGIKMTTAINGLRYFLDDIRAHQRFSGPFIGFDLLIKMNEWYAFTFGYEYHYARWRGQRLIDGPEYGNPPFGWTTGFSNVRHIDRVYGQVFNMEADYTFCGGWTLGLALKFQYFSGNFGKYKQTKRPLLLEFGYANVDGLWWRSFASTVYVGKAF